MSLLIAVISAVVGLFVGSALWVIARHQAADRRIFSRPIAADGETPLSGRAWLPLSELGGNGSIWRTPFELAVCAYFGLVPLVLDDRWDVLAVLVFSLPLLVILLVDGWTRHIHLDMIALGVVLGLGFSLRDGLPGLWRSLAGMVAGLLLFAFFYVAAALIYRSASATPFGLGDVYLAGMIGAMTGIGAVGRTLFLGVVLAAVILGVLVLARRLDRRAVVAYGPYLCAATLLSFLM